MDGASSQAPSQDQTQLRKALKWSLLLINIALMVIGGCSDLVTRIYFLHGGKRLWFNSLVQLCGWPLILVPLTVSYVHRRRLVGPKDAKIFLATPRILAACAVLGAGMGLNYYMFIYGISCLPVSTSSLLGSTQLAFNAVFAFLIVKHRFTSYSINAVVLMLFGASILEINSRGDRPTGESHALYYLGFAMTLGAALLCGLTMPLVELTYLKIKQKITYTLVVEMHVLLAIFGSLVCLVGVLVNKDFQAIPREAREFELGEVNYYIALAAIATLKQISHLGVMGVISCSSSLLAGVISAFLLPVVEILAVILLDEKFSSGKGLSLALCLWGFFSYFYGEWKQQKKATELELPIVR